MNNTLKAVLVIFAFTGVFLSGGIIGGVVTARIARDRFERFQHEREQRLIEQQQRELAQTKQLMLEQQQKELKQTMDRKLQDRPRPLPAPEQFSVQLMRRFSWQLDLTPEQRAKILPMVNAAAENLRRLRRDTAHSAEVTLEQVEDRIAVVLTPEQRNRFNELIQTQRERVQKYYREQQARMARQRQTEQP